MHHELCGCTGGSAHPGLLYLGGSHLSYKERMIAGMVARGFQQGLGPSLRRIVDVAQDRAAAGEHKQTKKLHWLAMVSQPLSCYLKRHRDQGHGLMAQQGSADCVNHTPHIKTIV